MSKALIDIENLKKRTLIELLNQCTENQQAFFNRMYGSRDTISKEKIDWAIQQCERTIKENKKGKQK